MTNLKIYLSDKIGDYFNNYAWWNTQYDTSIINQSMDLSDKSYLAVNKLSNNIN